MRDHRYFRLYAAQCQNLEENNRRGEQSCEITYGLSIDSRYLVYNLIRTREVGGEVRTYNYMLGHIYQPIFLA